MQISKGKMVLYLDENLEKLKETIKELERVKQVLIQSVQYKLLRGKTQTMDMEDTKIRARSGHSEKIAEIGTRIIEEIYNLCASSEIKETEIFKLNKQVEILYTQIVSLGHDLGHTPFGHDGERSINEFVKNIQDSKEIKKILEKRVECFGIEYEMEQGHIGEEISLSFEHNEQSSLLFYQLAQVNKFDINKVDVKRIIKAILAHSTTRVQNCPEDLVAQIVRQTDKIEYRNADFEEMRRYIILKKEENQEYVKLSQEERIDKIVEELAKEAIQEGKISDTMTALEGLKKLRKEYEKSIHFLVDGQKGLLTGKNIERNRIIVLRLLEYYYGHPDKLKDKSYGRIYPISKTEDSLRKVTYIKDKEETNLERVVEYVLSLDNERAKNAYLRLVKQRIVTGKGIEPISQEEIEEMKRRQISEKVEKLRAAEVVKTAQPHTDKELRNIVIGRDKLFVQNCLTEEGRAQIKTNYKIIEQENEQDKMLGREMKLADLNREYGILGKEKKEDEQEEKRLLITRDKAQRIKKDWLPITEIPLEQQMPYQPEDIDR